MKRQNKQSEQTYRGGEQAGHGIRWYWLMAVVGVMVLIILAWAMVYLQFHDRDESLAARQIETGAQALAGRLSEQNLFRLQLLEGIARDPNTTALFRLNDRMALREREDQLTQIVPGVLRIRLLPAGQREPDSSVMPHLGYASLELMRQAEKQLQTPPAEVHQFGSAQQYVAMVVAVRSAEDETVLGVIHAAFPAGGLQDSVDSVKEYAGRVEVRQVVDRASALVLAMAGSVPPDQQQPDGTLPVSGSIWEVAYWKSSVGKEGFTNDLMLLLPGLVAIVLSAALLLLLAEGMRRALKKDQYSILELMESVMMGKSPTRHMARLLDMQATLEILEHQAREVRTRRIERRAKRKRDAGSRHGITVDEDLFSASDMAEDSRSLPPVRTTALSSAPVTAVPVSIFRAYDIRGLVDDTLNEEGVEAIGRAVGSEIYEQGFQTVVVARDGRHSSERLAEALVRGLRGSGRDVIDVGLAPTPLLYFAAHEFTAGCGVVVTGSHNPPEYNGIKVVIGGESLSSEGIQSIYRRIQQGNLLQGDGDLETRGIIPEYTDRVINDVSLARGMKVVVDCGNGASSVLATQLFQQLGCEVEELFCDVDGDFPNHHPDPSRPENMQALSKQVVESKADIGFAFDGDGDRVGVVDASGKIIWPDRVLMYLAMDVLSREPGGDIVYDVKCSRHLANVVLANGGRPLMWMSGHSMLKAKMKETGALLAGEFSGHIMFAERWYGFDDGLYAAARLLEILTLDPRSSTEIFAELPESVSTPEYSVALKEGESDVIMAALDKQPDLPGARLLRIDGLRAEFEQGWGLVRTSNTTPALIFRFEAEDEDALNLVMDVFRNLLGQVQPDLKLPF
ncbi:MAG: phosphomannomutase/phosphoglucomutase [endosymbiont of Escarpia spicata]|uniref:phosphomannomutase n=1 Tax=endosymbiont of Escarpia spicata TaxID=2200908 RepID=A0A370DCH6_9GAMM|nr:MAG: phosphomannomutase/phosphoglucomutase [endosymbiont of Escarpia spicata]